MRRACVVLALLVGACEPSQSKFGPGLELQLRVAEAQLHRGELGADQGGPAVSQVSRPQIEVMRGESSVALNGRLAPGGVALHLQAIGDGDHWVVPADGFDFVVDDELRFTAQLEFSHAIQTDELRVRLQAADRDGRLGPVTETSFTMRADLPPARLLVSLGWDAPVDLDLHVLDPNGAVIGAKDISDAGGTLDFDSNQDCVLDLVNRENILWLDSEPPPGRYQVFAHLYAPCGQAAVNMIAVVQYAGELVLRAGATQYELDSRVHPVEGEVPGLLLAEFEVR